jgi:heptosyltransferase-2
MNPPQHILVRGVNWLGDAIMTTPALMRLREAFPQIRITLLTPAKLAGLWTGHPALDAVLAFEPGAGLLSVARQVRSARADLGLLFPNSPRSALELWLGRVPERIGVARPWRNGLLTRAIPARAGLVVMRKRTPAEVRALLQAGGVAPVAIPPESHQLHHYLHLVAALGAKADPLPPTIRVSAAEVAALRQRFGVSDGQAVLGINPGAEYGPAKRWPAERFAAAARAVRQQTGCRLWIFGGAGDVPVAREIAAALSREGAGDAVTVLAGQTNLRELCAALKACRVLLTNDTGPMHLGAAVGTPLVALFGSTSPELTGPGLPGVDRHALLRRPVPCSPCFLRECPADFACLLGLTTQEVTAAVLAKWRPQV